jgi:phosphotriesterase-related protein
MAYVETVRGAVDTSLLGITLMHEHIFVLSPEINQNYPETWGDEEERINGAVHSLQELKSTGVDTLVDLTVIGLGRYIPRIQTIAAQVDLNIVVATGVYTFNELPPYFRFRKSGPRIPGSDVMADMFARDIREGIGKTGVKAAILKCATDLQGVTPGVERVIRAVAKAQRETGVPISTHTHVRNKCGLEQQRIFEEAGVDLSRVIIGHCGDTTDTEYLERLMEKGSYIGMDRFGIDTLLPFDRRVDMVAELCRKGYEGKIVLSQDAACYNDNYPEESLATAARNWNYLRVMRDVVPALKVRGVTDEQISTMLVRNPRRIFEGNAIVK